MYKIFNVFRFFKKCTGKRFECVLGFHEFKFVVKGSDFYTWRIVKICPKCGYKRTISKKENDIPEDVPNAFSSCLISDSMPKTLAQILCEELNEYYGYK